MSALGSFSAQGFQVTASSAVDLIAGSQAAGAGMVSANLQELAREVRVDFAQLGRSVAAQGRQLASVNADGFAAVRRTLEGGFGSLETLSGISIATQAIGFAVVATQLAGVRLGLHDLYGKAAELVELQRHANAHLETLGEFAQRQLHTQEQILATLVSSRTVEAQQLIRQGWDNLHNGYEDEAFERFVRSLDYDNTVYFTHAELGALYEKRGDPGRAEDHFRRATRFAAQAGPPVVGFASVQLAAFLDRSGRAPEALQVLRQGLATWRSPAWLFYAAELAAETGDESGALQTLCEAIGGDAALFTAAMASERLQRTPMQVAHLLMGLDGQVRGGVFETIQRGVVGVRQLTALGVDVGRHRAAAGSLFERAVSAAFSDLANLQNDAEALATRCAQEVDQHARGMSASVQASRDEYLRQLHASPSVVAPGAPAAAGRRVLVALFLLAPGALFSLLALLVVATESSGSGKVSGLIGLALTTALFTFPGVVAWLRTREKEQEEREQALRLASEAWNAWDRRLRALAEESRRRCANMQQRLSNALSFGHVPVLQEGIQWLGSQVPGGRQGVPAWVLRASDDTPALPKPPTLVVPFWATPAAVVGFAVFTLIASSVLGVWHSEKEESDRRAADARESTTRAAARAAEDADIRANYDRYVAECEHLIARGESRQARDRADRLLEASPGEPRATEVRRQAAALADGQDELARRRDEARAQQQTADIEQLHMAGVQQCVSECLAPFDRCVQTYGTESCADVGRNAESCRARCWAP
ncbi:MAG: hypothetical protein EPO40_21995 [Myxococcaceae bacterium]|nr:MAG: hypothetical protein EPO40_21995 [Myxococcaceae bacterium]